MGENKRIRENERASEQEIEKRNKQQKVTRKTREGKKESCFDVMSHLTKTPRVARVKPVKRLCIS